MTLTKTIATLAATLLMATSLAAAPLDVQGVKVDDTVTLEGVKLPLNGAGVRHKAIFEVAVVALYAPQKVGTLDELVAAPGPKRLAATVLREFDTSGIGRVMTRSIEDNLSKSEMSRIVPGLIRLGTAFAEQKKFMPGDRYEIDWIPGKGTVLTIKGVVQGEPFPEPEFFKALMSIWLGSVPADHKLKDNLLGKK